jgi:nitroreductase
VLRCIELALRAPTSSNGQNWEFVVVKDRSMKERLGRMNRQAVGVYGGIGKRVNRGNQTTEKILAAVDWQAEHFEEIPVLVVACLRGNQVPFVPLPPMAQWS